MCIFKKIPPADSDAQRRLGITEMSYVTKQHPSRVRPLFSLDLPQHYHPEAHHCATHCFPSPPSTPLFVKHAAGDEEIPLASVNHKEM